MEPLIDNFTKNLKPCSGCGEMSAVIYFIDKHDRGENMTFIVQVKVEANDVKQAIENIGSGNVISVNPGPQQLVGRVTGNSPQAQPNVTIMPQPTESTVFPHPG